MQAVVMICLEPRDHGSREYPPMTGLFAVSYMYFGNPVYTYGRNFTDPAFDGDPAFATQEEIDETGKTTKTEILTAENAEENPALHEAQSPYNASLQPPEFILQPSALSMCYAP
jgi:hypothetical protein